MKKTTNTRQFLILGLAFFVIGCGIVKTQKISSGFDIKSGDVNAIQKGVSTEKDILKTFGPPSKQRDTETGKEYFYEYSKSGGPRWDLVVSIGGSSAQKSLLVWFDKSGVVTDYAFKSS